MFTGFERVDLLVLPNLFGEGMPMVILEAMSVGLPVVATRVEGVPEVVRDDREGLLVEGGDANALSGALARFVRNSELLDRMGTNARSRRTGTYSQTTMAKRVSALYDRVLAGADRAALRCSEVKE